MTRSNVHQAEQQQQTPQSPIYCAGVCIIPLAVALNISPGAEAAECEFCF